MRDRLEAQLKRLVASLVLLIAGRRRSVPSATDQFERILVVRQHDQLGDMLCAIPLLNALRRRYPGARIALIGSPVNCEIMRSHPSLDEVLLYDKKRFLASPAAAWRFWRALRSFGAELAIVPVTVSISLTSDLLAIASGATARLGAASLHGERNPLAQCYTMRVELDWSGEPRRHQTLRNADVLAPLGITAGDLTAMLGLAPEEQRQAAEELRELRRNHAVLIGVHPGAGKAANRWPAQFFAELVNRLAGERLGVVVTAGPMDAAELEQLLPLLRQPPMVIQGRPLRQVAAIIDQLDLFVSNDTGIMHVAGATRTSLLALFGPTDPLQWAPVGRKNRFLSAPDGVIGSISVDAVHDTLALMLQERQLKK